MRIPHLQLHAQLSLLNFLVFDNVWSSGLFIDVPLHGIKFGLASLSAKSAARWKDLLRLYIPISDI